MKILVPIKRVLDITLTPRLNSENDMVNMDTMKHIINPFCEIALEEAIRIKEKHEQVEIILITIGHEKAQEQLRMGLALGACRAIHVITEQSLLPIDIAKILHHFVQQENIHLVLTGKQSIDGDHNQTGQMLAQLMHAPQGTFASHITLNNEQNQAQITKEVDGGLETINITLPAVITTDLRLNTPRFASIPNIMKAKRKPLDKLLLTDLPIQLKKHQEHVSYKIPEQNRKAQALESVNELVALIQQHHKG